MRRTNDPRPPSDPTPAVDRPHPASPRPAAPAQADEVSEASEESFPASDPPAFVVTTGSKVKQRRGGEGPPRRRPR